MKLGGMNSFLPPNQIPFIADCPTIILDADVAHPAPGDTKRPSIAALVGSMVARAARYSSIISVQDHHSEIIGDLANMIKEVLKKFIKVVVESLNVP